MAWQLIVDDNFTRADTTVGAAGTTTGAGNGWIDVLGSVFSISTNRLKGLATTNSYISKLLARPSSENRLNQRLRWRTEANQDSNSQVLGVLRYRTTGTNKGYMAGRYANSVYIWHYQTSVPLLATIALSSTYDVTHAYEYLLEASGASPTTITLTVTDLTTAAVVATVTTTDNDSNLQTAGQYSLAASSISGAVNNFTTLAQTYEDVIIVAATAVSMTPSAPSSGLSGIASGNITIAVNGFLASNLVVTPSDGGAGGTFTPSSLTFVAIGTGMPVSQTMTYTPGSVGAKTISVTNNGGLTNPSSFVYTAFVLNVIAVTDSNLFTSPYNTDSNGAGTLQSNNVKSGSTFLRWNTPGAYLKTIFSGTSLLLNVSVTDLVNAATAAGNYPRIAYSVDGGAWTYRQLLSSDTAITIATGLTAGTHSVVIVLAGAWWQADRWTTPVSALTVTGLTLDSAAVLSAPTLFAGRMIIYQDSNGEGYEALAVGVSVANQDATQATGLLFGWGMDCEVGVVAFAGQGYVTAGGGNVPTLANAWDKYSNARSRLVTGLLSPVPNYIVSLHGQNDVSTIQSSVTTLLTAWRVAGGASAWLIIGSPADQNRVSELAAAVTASGDGKASFVNFGTNLLGAKSGALQWSNSNHLSVRGHARFVSSMVKLTQSAVVIGTGKTSRQIARNR